MPALSNVAITDTFDTWRIRTNQIILKTNDLELLTSNSYIQANSSNYYAFLVDANTNAAFTKANSANYYVSLVDANTNAAFTLANSTNIVSYNAFNKANTANIIAKNAYDKSNSANLIAASSYDTANIAFDLISSAYDKANSANYYAYVVDANTSAAFLKANTANIIASLSYDKANSANYYASLVDANSNAAFVKANAALANTSGIVFGGNMTITGNLTALSYNTSSDERLKFLINTAPSGVDHLSPIQYEMRSHPGKLRYGFIAQEVQNVFPNLVSTDENGMLVLNYMDIIALLLQDYKETKQEIIKIKEQLQRLTSNV